MPSLEIGMPGEPSWCVTVLGLMLLGLMRPLWFCVPRCYIHFGCDEVVAIPV